MSILSQGTLHLLPDDMISALQQHPNVVEKRNSLTPLARNERICRVTIVKKAETRAQHLDRMIQDLNT